MTSHGFSQSMKVGARSSNKCAGFIDPLGFGVATPWRICRNQSMTEMPLKSAEVSLQLQLFVWMRMTRMKLDAHPWANNRHPGG